MLKQLYSFKSPLFPAFMIILVGTFLLLARYTQYSPASCQFDVRLTTPEEVDFSIYYNIGRGLNQKDNQKKAVETINEETTVSFCIPMYSKLVGLRFDPATKPISMTISSIKLTYSNGEVYDVPFDTLTPGAQIESHSIDSGHLSFITTPDANDPTFSLTRLQQNVDDNLKMKKALHYLVWLMSAILLGFLGRFCFFYFFLGV